MPCMRVCTLSLQATDFGMSVFLKPGQKLTDECGTAFYMAPEVLMVSSE